MAFTSLLGVGQQRNRRISITSKDLGTFFFDATTNEQNTAKLRVTDNPIESGSNISDHAVVTPKEVTITGVIVGYSEPATIISEIGKDKIDFYSYPLPLDVKSWGAKVDSVVGQVVNTYKNVENEINNIISDFIPNVNVAKVDKSNTTNRISTAYDALLSIQASRSMLDVLTTSKLYKNMLITSIQKTQTNYMTAYFTLTFREVFITGSKVGKGLTDYSNLGKTQPKERSESVLSKITG